MPQAMIEAGLYRAIVEQSPDAVILVDVEGSIRIWNARAETIFGHTAEEVLGRGLDFIIPESLRAAHSEGFRRAITTGQTKYAGRVLTTRSMHKDGRKLYVDLSFALLRNDAGQIVGSLATARDVTETYIANRAAKARMHELETELQALRSASAAGNLDAHRST